MSNQNYVESKLIEKSPRIYTEFGIIPGKSIYAQFEADYAKFDFVPKPYLVENLWLDFVP